MADPVVKFFSIFYGNQKIGELHEVEVGVNTGRTMVYGAEGFLALTRGAVSCTITGRVIVPVGGFGGIKLIQDAVDQKDVVLAQVIAGIGVSVKVGCTQFTVSSQSETGRTEGSFTWQGGKPTLT